MKWNSYRAPWTHQRGKDKQTNRKREIFTICSRVERKIKSQPWLIFFIMMRWIWFACMKINLSLWYVWNASMLPAPTAFSHKHTAWKNFNHLFFVMNTANIIITSSRLYMHFHLSLLKNWINKNISFFAVQEKTKIFSLPCSLSGTAARNSS